MWVACRSSDNILQGNQQSKNTKLEQCDAPNNVFCRAKGWGLGTYLASLLCLYCDFEKEAAGENVNAQQAHEVCEQHMLCPVGQDGAIRSNDNGDGQVQTLR